MVTGLTGRKSVGRLAAGVAAAALATSALGVGGTAPPSNCGKTLVFAHAIQGSPVAGAGLVNIGGALFFELTGSCVPGPYFVDATVEIDCGGFGTFSDNIMTAIPEGSFTSLPFQVAVPPGAPLNCVVRGEATIVFGDGTAIQSVIPDTPWCFARQKPGMPTTPLIQVQRATPSASFAHPGDQTEHVVTVTNNGSADFTGTFMATSEQRGRLPLSVASAEVAGFGPYANSGPVTGENFPLALPQHLGVDGCVILPPNPHSAQIPLVSENFVLPAGQTRVFDLSARSWPLSARGNIATINVKVEGQIATQNVAGCASFVTATETQIPPTYACVDAGAATQFLPILGTDLLIIGQPSAMETFEVVASLTGVQLNVVGNPPFATTTGIAAQTLTDNHGRIRTGISRAGNPNLFADSDVFELLLDYELRDFGQLTFPQVIDIQTVLNAPSGFESRYPYAIGRALVERDGRGAPAVLEFIYQLSINAITVDKGDLPVDIVSLEVEPTPTGFRVTARGSATGFRGMSTTLTTLDVKGDYRGVTGGGGLGPHTCTGDVTGDYVVDFNDLNEVLANWGLVVPPKTNGDCDGDSDVDFDDLNIVLNFWGTSC